jgi:hypothetical protein
MPGANVALEWFASLSMSPTTALQLKTALDSVLALYVTAFGAIPTDPNFRLQTVGEPPTPASGAAGRAPLSAAGEQ